MIEIKDLLSRFNDLLLKGEGRVDMVREVISSVTGIRIEPKDIKIKNNIIYLNIKPIYKNEIFLKKDRIFSKLEEVLGRRAPSKVR